MSEFIIKPKYIKKGDGVHKFNVSMPIFTNSSADISYLLNLAGYTKNAVIKSFKNCGDMFVLSIGKSDIDNIYYVFTKPEEYYMKINTDSIVIAGLSEDAMIQGLKALIRLIHSDNDIPAAEISDYPDISFRAVHTCMFRPDDGTEKEETSPEYVKKMITTAALCGYNYIFIEFWGMFPFSLDYAHWQCAYTKAEIEDLVSFAADKMHICPLPAQNLTSHAAWSRITSRKHTVLDQRPDLADMYIPGGWCFATENPKTQAFIKTVIDEMLVMFRNPPYMHTGCDKAFGFGSTEEDRTSSADMLFVKHLSFLNSYLRQKDVRMVMWGDMLYSSMDALYWKCDEKTADYLPKNILINIWTHNDPGKKWQDAEYFEKKGFETVYSPFINYKSIESMVSVCRERKSYGIVQTTWHKPQTAVPYVIFSGVLQYCGTAPDTDAVEKFAEKWYK